MTTKLYHSIHELTRTSLVKAGISFRSGGISTFPYTSLNLALHVGDNPAAVLHNQHRFSGYTGIKKLKYCNQIHSDTVINADRIPYSGWLVDYNNTSEIIGDALISTKPDATLGVFTADCVPIYILDTATPVIGIAHAGWRGTYAKIAVKTVFQMITTFGTDPKNCLVHLGPSIQKCCYEVSPDLLKQFIELFGKDVHNGQCLCLQTANLRQLVDAGVPHDSISISPYCTACNTDDFYSYRVEGGQTGRMLSFICLI